MSSLTPQISDFVASLESHPRATELIPLVEQLLDVDDFSAESQLTEILLDICADNPSLITDMWLLRGTILLEEGISVRALSIFWEAVHIQPTELAPWDRVIELFISREDFIHASYFLSKATSIFPENSEFSSLLHDVSQQFLITLQNSPGVSIGLVANRGPQSSVIPSKNLELPESSPSLEIFPEGFHNPWKMTQECLTGSLSSSNQKDKQSFVTYAHSAMRELLSLDGNFRDGFDQALIRLQLTDYKQPLMRLNHTRNQVAHANYVPSKKDIRKFYTLVQEIVTQFEQQYAG